MKLLRPDIAIVLVTFLGAAGWWFSKNAVQEITPNSFIALRFFIAAAVLTLFCWAQLRSLTMSQLLRSCSTGSTLGLSLLFWVVGLEKANSIGESAFIVSLTAVVVPIVGRLLFGEKISRLLPLALLTAIAGLVLLTVDNGFVFEAGQWYFLIAILGFGLHLNLSSHYVKSVPHLANSTLQLLMVALIAGAAAVIGGTASLSFSPQAWAWLLASALIATSLRFAIQNYAMPKISPSYAAMIFLLEPIWAAMLGAIVLGEALSATKITGCALIFAALLVFRGKEILHWWQQR